MAKIEYVGLKARKEDNIAQTGVVWYGPGDVQEVPDAAVHNLLAYADVWARPAEVGGLASLVNQPAQDAGSATVTEVPTGATAEAAAGAGTPAAATGQDAAPARFVLDGPDGPMVLDTMDDDALHALSDRLVIETEGAIKRADGRLKGDKLRAAVLNAVKAASGAGPEA